MDQQAGLWASQWAADKAYPAIRGGLSASDLAKLDQLTVCSIREAAATFAVAVGLGWDKMHPQAIRGSPGPGASSPGAHFHPS